MASREDTNIQKLLSAEKTAQEIVGAARKERAEKMKLAKQEAEREITTYRTERENEYQSKVAESSSVSDTTFGELDKKTNAEIAAITSRLPTKKKECIDMLVAYVEKVDLAA